MEEGSQGTSRNPVCRHAYSTPRPFLPMGSLMRTRVPLRCVQATAAAGTARFRLWTEPADTDYEGSLDFKGRAADFHGTRRASGR